MIRTTVTKLKRACALARFPQILQADAWNQAASFEKLSIDHKSTTTGSNDDEEKCKKCQRIIDLAFGKEKSEDEIEKIEASCEKDDTGQQYTLNATKIEDEEKILQKIEKVEETPIVDAAWNENRKCKRLIELAFGPDKPEPVAEIEKVDASKMPQVETETIAQMATPTDSVVACNKANKAKRTVQEMRKKEFDLAQVTTEATEKLAQKAEKEAALMETDINLNKQTMILDKDSSNIGHSLHHRKNIYEELAKRCLNSPNDKIDNKILKEMNQLGISQQRIEDLPHNLITSKDIPKDSFYNNQNVAIESNIELKTRAIEKNKIKTGRRNVVGRRVIKHLALHLGTDNVSDIPPSDKKKLNINTNTKDTLSKLIDTRHLRTEHEVLIDRKDPPNKEAAAVNCVEGEIEKLIKESFSLQMQRKPVLICKDASANSSFVVIKDVRAKNIKKRGREIDKHLNKENVKESVTPPIVAEADDLSGFRITAKSPQPVTFADQLTSLNSKFQQSVADVLSKKKKDVTVLTETSEQPEFKNDIEKIFREERIPRHLFAAWTILSKDFTTGTEIGNASKSFYDQDLEREQRLIKPERFQYYSHNDDLECKDCTLEIDPQVVIKECDDDISSEPTETEPYSTHYSNYYNNRYQANMQQNITPSDKSGMSHMAYYNKFMNAHTYHNRSNANNMWNAVTTGNFVHGNQSFYNNYSANKYTHDHTAYDSSPSEINGVENTFSYGHTAQYTPQANDSSSTPSTYDPNQVLIDPYGKNIKNEDFEESEYTNFKTLPQQDNPQESTTKIYRVTKKPVQSNIPLNPVLTTRFVVNDGSIGPGDASNTSNPDHKKEKGKIQAKDTTKPCMETEQKGQKLTNIVPSQAIINSWIDNRDALPDSRNPYAYTKAHEPIKVTHNTEDSMKQIKPGNPSEALSYHHYETHQNRQNFTNIEPSNTMMNPETYATDSMKCNAYIDVQESVKVGEMPIINPSKKPLSLSEMLKRVRERARLETLRQEVLIAAPVTKVDPAQGSCKKPKPPCPPPQKTCPPSPPKCPPSNCPKPEPPCPKPCKPACPDPCATPKCPPSPKKDPCAKFHNQKGDTLDILGLVVTLGVVDIPETDNLTELLSKQPVDEKHTGVPFIIEEIFMKCYDLFDYILMPEMKRNILERDENVELLDVLSETAAFFPKDYEPWTPIPSWPIPAKRDKKKLVCPAEGCKVRPPPPPGAPCNNIHHPCAGFPNDKKRT